jgi:Zn finger protein HypA/HybF involved in hydrogenase expression
MRQWRAEHREELNAKRRVGPFPTTCVDCSKTFAARVRSQVRCPDCQAAMLRVRKR